MMIYRGGGVFGEQAFQLRECRLSDGGEGFELPQQLLLPLCPDAGNAVQFPGARVLDLFGGTGQLGIEALSRGAKSAVFVDAREDACKLIRENLKRTRLQEDARVIRSDYLDYLSRCREQYDIIFLDPPYAEVFLEKSLNRITEIDILHSGGIIVAERPLGKELPWDYPGYTRSRDYQYGKILLTFYRKDGGSQETI